MSLTVLVDRTRSSASLPRRGGLLRRGERARERASCCCKMYATAVYSIQCCCRGPARELYYGRLHRMDLNDPDVVDAVISHNMT